MAKRGRHKKIEDEKVVMCPICGQAFKDDNDDVLFIEMTLHLYEHTKKKIKDKTLALEKAIKFARLFVDQQTGKITYVHDNIAKEISEFIEEFSDNYVE